jgi:hypothetical protein
MITKYAVKLYTLDGIDGNTDPATQDIEIDCTLCDWNAPANSPSRPARTALRHYIQKFRSLEWMPGGEYSGSYNGDELTRLYKEVGWPSEFNRKAFLESRQEWKDADARRYEAEQPLAQVVQYEKWLRHGGTAIVRYRESISLINEGGELPEGMTDREGFKQELERKYEDLLNGMEENRKELRIARGLAEIVDPGVRRRREERIRKYGY